MKFLFLVITGILLVDANQGQPGIVTNVTKTLDWGYIKLTWSEVASALNYTIELRNETATIVKKTLPKTNLTWEYSPVPTNVSCSFSIFASNNNGSGENVTEKFTSPVPQPPMNLSITLHPDDEKTKLFLQWNHHPEVSSLRRLQNVRYKIEYADKPALANPTIIITDTLVSNYTIPGLEENTKYWVRVSLYDKGTGDQGQPANAEITTKNGKIENWIIAVIAILTTVLIILIIVIVTNWHFRSKYPKS